MTSTATPSDNVTPPIEDTPVTVPAPSPVAPVKITPKPTVAETRKPAEVTDFQTLVSGLRLTGTTAEKHLVNVLASYLAEMSPGVPKTFEEGARQQYNLSLLFDFVLNNSSPVEFTKLWSILIAYFREYKDGVFGIRYAFRFSELWVWGDDALRAFEESLNMLMASASYGKSDVYKHVSLNKALAKGFTPGARGRLLTFYQG